mgnify:CR=1 FL=1
MADASDYIIDGNDVPDPLEMPALACGAMEKSKPFVAKANFQEPLGFPDRKSTRLNSSHT